MIPGSRKLINFIVLIILFLFLQDILIANDKDVLRTFFNRNNLTKEQQALFKITYDEDDDSKIVEIKLQKDPETGRQFKSWISIKDLFKLTSLRLLDLVGADEPLGGILDKAVNLKTIKKLDKLRVLKLPSLDLESGKYDSFFKTLEKMENIKFISLSLRNVTEKQVENLPENVTELDLAKNYNLEKVNLSYLLKLKYLNLGFCGITNISKSKFPKNLKEMNLYWNSIIKIDLSHLENLEALYLIDCSIKDLSESKFPESLRLLNVSGNKKLQIANLSDLDRLSNLNLSRCDLTKVVLKDMHDLVRLDLSDNENLGKVSISGIPNLKNIIISASLKDEIEQIGFGKYESVIKYR